jgi:acetyl-CoA synthetase
LEVLVPPSLNKIVFFWKRISKESCLIIVSCVSNKMSTHEHQILPVTKNSHFKSFEEYKALYEQSIKDSPGFWGKLAKENIVWMKPFDQVFHGSFKDGDLAWFLNGQLNITMNCIDRHLPRRENQIAIIWEGDDPNDSRRITYRELFQQVCRIANVLKESGVRKGDTVAIYMPMIPEAAFCMLACARIGAIHSVVFAGFSAESLRHRINDAQAKVVMTANEGIRGGRVIPLKQTVDEALLHTPSVQKVFVFFRTNKNVSMEPSRDVNLQEAMDRQRPYCPPEAMNSEDPLFILYTSGSTGKPKGLVHTTAGYLLYVMLTHRYVFDIREGDVYACVADIGWITGHSYVLYGPLSNGSTTLMFESIPTHPDAGRYWDLVQRHKVSIFYTAPTAIRTLMKFGEAPVKKYDRSSLRVLGTVGEPINPEAWRWYYNVVGEGKCSIVDTYWQTETGGIVISALAGLSPMKPGSASFPFFGIQTAVFDNTTGKLIAQPSLNSAADHSNPKTRTNIEGILCLSNPWPSLTRTCWGDHQRYLATYMNQYPGYYMTGDGCIIDSEGFVHITGRVDDVINKAGHRLGTAEIESSLVAHPSCAEAAVIAIPDDVRGSAIVAYCTLKSGYAESDDAIGELRNSVRKLIGPIATPDKIVITPALPKTRSGKIMRRILRKIATGETSKEQIGDLSTLADPEVVQNLIEIFKRSK